MAGKKKGKKGTTAEDLVERPAKKYGTDRGSTGGDMPGVQTGKNRGNKKKK